MDNNQNKRIAKNTIFMYIRMAITMCIGLYTSRAVLQSLGVEDFGLYNVIGGIVSMFVILNNAMVNTTSRFITVYLAKEDDLQTRRIFNMASLVHIIIAVLVVIFAETIGMWYLENKLVVPEGRMFAAEWLYQLSILSSVFAILYVPYNAAIVAHEKMGTFAFIQIADSIVKLIIVLLLAYSPFDKLIFYATLLAILSIVDFFIYFIYCKRHFLETKMMYYWNNFVFKEMIEFAGWTLVGNFVNFFYTQGLNLLLNAFCGPAANAARGIAVLVENVVKQFANNVQVAINPQILKSFSLNEMDRMYSLIMASSRYCFFLLYFLCLPIMFEANFILKLWLGIVPAHSVNFIRLILVVALFDTFVNPMFTANLACGKLKLYHLPLSILMVAFMFVTYFAIKLTGIAESVYISLLTVTIIGYIMKIYIIDKQIGLKPNVYLKNVLKPVCLVILVSPIAPFFIHNLLDEGWHRLLINGSACVISVMASIYYLGVSQSERVFVIAFVKNKFKR